MAPHHSYKPENVKRRAEDLISVGQDEAALQTLYDLITSKRLRNVVVFELEPLAELFLSLCIKLKNSKLAKDGLHQYKRNVQSYDGGLESVSKVTSNFLKQAEQSLDEAHSSAENVLPGSAGTTSFQDEDDEDETSLPLVSPEDILMSSVSTDDSKDRSDRDIIVPWLRFLWDAYRTVLDILRNNSKLEVEYCNVVFQVFKYCLKFERKTEFRRLAELLRSHLQTVSQKPSDKYQVTNPVDLSNSDTLQRYLDTRLEQLNVAVKLELWQESFRSVEDFHTLLSSSKRQPKPKTLIEYYDNLAKIFERGDNHLFHAAARQKFFALFSRSPIATKEEKQHAATLQLLSALAVPQGSSDVLDEFAKRKNNRLSSLLSFTQVPTREFLLEQVVALNTLSYVDPALAELYDLLEVNFHPLEFASKANKLLNTISSHTHYVKPLLNVILDKVFLQVSEVYESIKLDFLVKLTTLGGSFKLTPLEIENSLLDAASRNILTVKIDQEAGVATFNSTPFEDSFSMITTQAIIKEETPIQLSASELIRYQLSNLAKTLSASISLIDPTIKDKEAISRTASLTAANAGFAAERESILKRQQVLDQRITRISEVKRKEEELAAKERLEKLEATRKAEQERAEQELIKRAEDKRIKEIEAAKKAEKKKVINEVNANGIIKVDLKDIDNIKVEDLLQKQVDKLEQDRLEMESKLDATSKRYDYIERANRQYELQYLSKDAEGAVNKEREAYDAMKEKIISQAKKEHEEAIKIRDRLQKIVPTYNSFLVQLKEKMASEHEAAQKEAAAKLEEAKQARIAEFIAAKKAEHEAVEQAVLKKAEEEKQRKAAEAKLAADREARTKRYEEERLAQDPERREYQTLLAQEASNSLKFSSKRRLRELKQKYGN